MNICTVWCWSFSSLQNVTCLLRGLASLNTSKFSSPLGGDGQASTMQTPMVQSQVDGLLSRAVVGLCSFSVAEVLSPCSPQGVLPFYFERGGRDGIGQLVCFRLDSQHTVAFSTLRHLFKAAVGFSTNGCVPPVSSEPRHLFFKPH